MFRKRGIRADYKAIEVRPDQLKTFMRNFRENFIGANVTLPHKEKIIKYLDFLSPEAKKIGAVNTIINHNGKLTGFNTDVFGAISALRKNGVKNFRGKKVFVIGAGGAARAIVYGLKKAGAKITILNRTLSRVKKLARDFGCEYSTLIPPPSSLHPQLIINATSVGMWPNINQTPISDFKFFTQNPPPSTLIPPLVMDIVYRPRMTKFLREAKKAGCRIISGDHMFFAQAKKSFELFTARNRISSCSAYPLFNWSE